MFVVDFDNCFDGVVELIVLEDIVLNVLAGFEVFYVFIFGNDFVIQDVNVMFQFIVAEIELFIIYIFVYDLVIFDFSIVEFGVIIGVDVNNLFIQGGGDICVFLFVVGVQFQVEECFCIVDVGILIVDFDNCLDGIVELIVVED